MTDMKTRTECSTGQVCANERQADDFSTAKVGDRLWSLMCGEVEVLGHERGSLRCRALQDGVASDWHSNGHYYFDTVTPDLYWSKPEIIAPPRPKRMKEMRWELWVNVYANGESHFHRTLTDADMYAALSRIGPAEHVVITRMVEE